MRKAMKQIKKRFEYLRGELKAERISYGELAELMDLAEYIDPDDMELREAAGIPEFPESVKGFRCNNCGLDAAAEIVPEHCPKCNSNDLDEGTFCLDD
jgi:predicted Zn-ribbon and HTH transcriptional regulator